jgi:uncharacterized membrane protein YdbT with pleckstrin-like domain
VEQPLKVYKPNIVNALFPSLGKSVLISAIITVFLYGLSFVLTLVGVNLPLTWTVFAAIGLFVIIALIPFLIQVISLVSISYYFYSTHVTREYNFIVQKKYSTPYSKIVNISVHISIWDRLIGAGDITIHTAEDNTPDMILKYVKPVDEVEKQLYEMIRRTTSIQKK